MVPSACRCCVLVEEGGRRVFACMSAVVEAALGRAICSRSNLAYLLSNSARLAVEDEVAGRCVDEEIGSRGCEELGSAKAYFKINAIQFLKLMQIFLFIDYTIKTIETLRILKQIFGSNHAQNCQLIFNIRKESFQQGIMAGRS